jgi:hypothetical protein
MVGAEPCGDLGIEEEPLAFELIDEADLLRTWLDFCGIEGGAFKLFDVGKGGAPEGIGGAEPDGI